MTATDLQRPRTPWRSTLHTVIFEAETRAGRTFDFVLLGCILLSVLTVMLESVAEIRTAHGATLARIEWAFTLLFTVEYLLRLVSVRRPLRYATSFFGLVDLLAIMPTYLSLVVPGTQYLLVVRVLRLLRVFRVLKLSEYLVEADVLVRALRASRFKISVFLLTVITLVIIVGSVMYVVEGEANGFTDIPTSLYWAVVTLTTVGYGDVTPRTWLGQLLASVVMLLGYGIIAVPTGIVTLELSRASQPAVSTQACATCGAEGHDPDALYCKYCGAQLWGLFWLRSSEGSDTLAWSVRGSASCCSSSVRSTYRLGPTVSTGAGVGHGQLNVARHCRALLHDAGRGLPWQPQPASTRPVRVRYGSGPDAGAGTAASTELTRPASDSDVAHKRASVSRSDLPR